MRIIMLTVLLTTVSCGKYATDRDLNKLDNRVDEIDTRVVDLENKVNANISSIESLSNSVVLSSSSISSLQEEMEQADADNADALQNAINEATSGQNSLLAMIETLQEQTTTLLANKAALELEDRVVGIFDPCPNVVSTDFTESFFQMSSGKLVAYFENGNTRFLTVLKTGTSYQTTDSRACVFSL